MTDTNSEPMPKGTRVILSRVRHESYRGLQGTVRRFVKRRGVYDIVLDDGRSYDALPGNIDAVVAAEANP